MKQLTRLLHALAFGIAVLMFGVPSAPIADSALRTTSQAFADHHDDIPRHLIDTDGDGLVDSVDGCPTRYGDLPNGCPSDGPREPPPDIPGDPDAPPTAPPPDDDDDEWDCGPLLEDIQQTYDGCISDADKAWGNCKAEARDAADIFWEWLLQRCNGNKEEDEGKCAAKRDKTRSLLPDSCDD